VNAYGAGKAAFVAAPVATDLFSRGHAALAPLIAGLVRRVCEPRVEVEAEDVERLLTAWLLELLFITEVEDLVFRRFEVQEASPRRLVAVAHGEPLDRERHPKGAVVKAVTRHHLEVRPFEGGYRVRVLLDI